jgi:hypothetical protein
MAEPPVAGGYLKDCAPGLCRCGVRHKQKQDAAQGSSPGLFVRR